ncbi:MAG: hypothetical protein ACXVQU_13035, partial [Actinomycetota bacterium]
MATRGAAAARRGATDGCRGDGFDFGCAFADGFGFGCAFGLGFGVAGVARLAGMARFAGDRAGTRFF